jgi:hypothetical protein
LWWEFGVILNFGKMSVDRWLIYQYSIEWLTAWGEKMLSVTKGLINDKKITQKIFKNLEHGAINKVNALVLHRTDSPTAKSTLLKYANKASTGAHFLVAEDGVIYQTAGKNTWKISGQSQLHFCS